MCHLIISILGWSKCPFFPFKQKYHSLFKLFMLVVKVNKVKRSAKAMILAIN